VLEGDEILFDNRKLHESIRDKGQAFSFIQRMASEEATRAYTPGYPTLAQPFPLHNQQWRQLFLFVKAQFNKKFIWKLYNKENLSNNRYHWILPAYHAR
jgi:hypothetical protein